MAASVEQRVTAAVVVVAAVAVGAYLGASVFAPLVLALFIIAVVWPLQQWLQARLPKLLALALTIIVTVAVCLAFASLAVWGFGRVGRSLVADSARYQALYNNVVTWLDSHGVSVAGLWAEHFNVGWLLRATQQITGRISTTLRFWIIALVYVILGLLEIDDIRRKIEALGNRNAARVLLDGSAATAVKFQKYMLVRTQMSAMTGLGVGAFAWITGLQFAAEWGVIAFVLNYIPFVGPFIATLFPTLLAMTQFGSWQAVLGGLHLPQHHPVCRRQLCRAPGLRQRAVDFAYCRAVRDLLLDLPMGHFRHLHRWYRSRSPFSPSAASIPPPDGVTDLLGGPVQKPRCRAC
jgi:AI-2 transport protein TqsA